MKKTVFFILLISLLIPKLQEQFKIFEEKPLAGATVSKTNPKINFEGWMSGEYQNTYNEYNDETFGLRNWFIRLYNQIDFSLFSKSHADVVVGKNGYLFQQGYIDEVTGKIFIGNNNMKTNVEKIKRIENYLSKKNIFLLTVLAPGKTDYYKEYLPEYYFKRSSDQRNYNALLKFGAEKNIRILDFNKWALQLKDTSRYSLFPKHGIHWNYYCMALCVDSMIKYIEKGKNVKLTNFSWTIETPDELRGTDYDLGDLLNICERLPYNKMPYPHFSYHEDSTVSKPKLLVIGDSFYWTIFNERIFNNIFTNETYLYYYSSVYPSGRTASDFTPDLDILTEVEKYDVVLLLQSSGNYGNPGVNFVQAVDMELERLDQFTDREVRNIKEDERLLVEAKQLADSLKISQESAQIVFAERKVRKYFSRLSEIKIQMRKNPEWIKDLYQKSTKQKKTMEQIMEADADWMIRQEENKR